VVYNFVSSIRVAVFVKLISNADERMQAHSASISVSVWSYDSKINDDDDEDFTSTHLYAFVICTGMSENRRTPQDTGMK